ncbi:hypothetical protein evm_012103 [Chilo suppressalis]|nr:hypothetical protein evm_012103 [Chilo suppressalis]
MTQCTSDSEEELLLYFELGDDVDIEQFKNINVLGVNSKNQIVQMDDTVFIGKYENPLGTYMFFKDVPPPISEDPVFDQVPAKNLEYLSKTRKLIKMEHTYITPNNMEGNSGNETLSLNTIEPVTFESYEKAIENFKTYWESISSGENLKMELNK